MTDEELMNLKFESNPVDLEKKVELLPTEDLMKILIKNCKKDPVMKAFVIKVSKGE